MGDAKTPETRSRRTRLAVARQRERLDRRDEPDRLAEHLAADEAAARRLRPRRWWALDRALREGRLR